MDFELDSISVVLDVLAAAVVAAAELVLVLVVPVLAIAAAIGAAVQLNQFFLAARFALRVKRIHLLHCAINPQHPHQ